MPTFCGIIGSVLHGKVEGIFPQDLSSLAKKLHELPDISSSNHSADSISSNIIAGAAQSQQDKELVKLINLAPVMLFMKGSPSQPRCGFSRQIVEILNKESVPFLHFDILSDETVRAGLKAYSDWPTYPQLYVNGSLVGGLDIVKEMIADGKPLKEQLGNCTGSSLHRFPLLIHLNIYHTGIREITLPPPPSTIEERLRALINKAPVMLFMKGDPSTPRCGFSRSIVEILQTSNIQFESFDILSDEDVRASLKTYSDWPTYPQLYVNGSLVGGLDIVKEMAAGGNLLQQLGLN